MASTPLPWTSNYPSSLDDATSMPEVSDVTHTQSASQINSVANSLKEVQTHLGTPSGAAVGSITNRVETLESASGYIQLDNTYTDAWYSGASPKYNPTTGRLALGFHDEFPGSTLDAGWTSGTGDSGNVTVTGNSLVIEDGNAGTNYPYIRRPIVNAQSFEWKCHVTNDFPVANGTAMVVGVYSGTDIATNLYCITQLQRTGVGSNLVTYGSYGSIVNTASVTAQWMRLLVNTYGWMFCVSNNAHTSEPTADQWTRLSFGAHGTPFVFPTYFFVFVRNSSAIPTITYTLRHLYFRYL